jgi:hypothetical protein
VAEELAEFVSGTKRPKELNQPQLKNAIIDDEAEQFSLTLMQKMLEVAWSILNSYCW